MSIDESWKALKSELHRLRSAFVPKFTSSGKPTWNEKGSFPVSKSTRAAIQAKKKCHRNWIAEQKTGNDDMLTRLRYNRARNKVKQFVRRDKRDFERNIAAQAKKRPKAFWSHARRKLKTKHGIAPLLADVSDKDTLKFDDKEKADILQQQFSSVFTKEPAGALPEFHKRCMTNIHLRTISGDDVKKKLKCLNPDKSIGPDDLHARLLTELADELSEPLAAFFNETVNRGKLPADWKLAFISSIYKKGAKNRAENYRPISLTSIVCKVMESFMRDAILEHMVQHNHLSNMVLSLEDRL